MFPQEALRMMFCCVGGHFVIVRSLYSLWDGKSPVVRFAVG